MWTSRQHCSKFSKGTSTTGAPMALWMLSNEALSVKESSCMGGRGQQAMVPSKIDMWGIINNLCKKFGNKAT